MPLIEPVLETERLVLRELSPTDLDFVATMLADAEVMHYWPNRYTREESQAWLERQLDRYARDGHGLWLTTDRATGDPVGQVGLLRQSVDGVDELEVGYLLHQPFWHRGFATEAAGAVRDYAFDRLGRDRVISLIRPENVASIAVAQRIGMVPGKRTVCGGFEHIVFSVTHASA